MLDIIQNLCKENGISIFKLEKELGFGNGTIYKWEKSSPAVDKLKKIADYFGVSVDSLLSEDATDSHVIRIVPNMSTLERRFSSYGLTFDIVEGGFFKYVVVSYKNKVVFPEISVASFQRDGLSLLEYLVEELGLRKTPETIAAHHDGEEWTEEELEEIERFKQFVKMKRGPRTEE